ncbi:hypothetical protein FRB99_004124 [Tulasnella sp. 403]|nr:hypothetical protein FRB99_004124 [Tulasnella sp. 403]
MRNLAESKRDVCEPTASLIYLLYTRSYTTPILTTSPVQSPIMQVTLVSSDNENFVVDKEVIERSDLIRSMLTDMDESDRPVFPLPNVNAGVLKKVLEYCDHYRGDPLPASDTTEISEWDQKFLQVDQEMLFEIIRAANYLDIKPLLDVACKNVANMIKGKTPEEIRKLLSFNLVNDFTPEEEAQIRKESEWAED